ncbi:unnamed protein product [Brassica oleracea]
MYKERGTRGSKSEVVVVDQKRVNKVHDNHRASHSMSHAVNGKGKAVAIGKQLHDHNARPDSLSKPTISDDVSDTDSEESEVSGSEGEDTSWVSWFCNLRGNEFFCEVDDDYIQDDFNLCGLNHQVPYYDYALDLILDVDFSQGERFTDEQNELVESAAEMLYGMIHARYILTSKGLASMLDKYKNYDCGRCPRVYCCGQPCLPVGQSDIPRSSTVKIYCPKCEDVYYPRSKYQGNIDGAYFGTTFPHLFLMTYGHLKPQKAAQSYVPRVFGALFSLISCRNAIRSRGGIGERSFISNRIGSLSGVERCSSHGSMSNEDDDARRFSLGTGRVIQRRHFLGCGDGEEGGGGELSKIYEERRVLGYSQEQLFNVVLAVDLYHGFVPWCQRSEVLKQYPDGSFDAELEIGFKFLVESYISHVDFERPKWIKTTARDTGLFDHLINLWQFKPGPIPGTCELSILVDFKFNSPLYRQVASMFLKEVATRLIGAFSDRCRLVYGPGVPVDENSYEQKA